MSLNLSNKNNDNIINTNLPYIKIDHKNKIEELKETDYYNEIMTFTNSLQQGEQNIGFEINKFFQYITKYFPAKYFFKITSI